MNPHRAAAIEDMRLARSYIEDIGKGKGEFRSTLAFATKHLERARAKDPTALMTVTDPQWRPVPFSIDEIAGELLFCEAVYELADNPSEKQMRHAAETLKKSLQYRPYSIGARIKLADLYLDLYERSAALEIAREGVRVSPSDLDARKLLDRIENAPDAKRPSWVQRNPGVIESIGGGAFLVGLLLFIPELLRLTPEGFSMLLMFGGGIAWLYGHFKFKDDLAQKYIADRLRKRKT